LGRRGERLAANFLRRKRHRVLVRNYRCPAGEVDLVCSDGRTLVFVEVKTRADFLAQEPNASATKDQWNRVCRAAQYFGDRFRTGPRPFRFDLVTVECPQRGAPRIDHFLDAFRPDA